MARRRGGATLAASTVDEVLPAIEVTTVDDELHRDALVAFRASTDTAVSVVDRTSFAFMRRSGIGRAIAIDRDVRTAGFVTLP